MNENEGTHIEYMKIKRSIQLLFVWNYIKNYINFMLIKQPHPLQEREEGSVFNSNSPDRPKKNIVILNKTFISKILIVETHFTGQIRKNNVMSNKTSIFLNLKPTHTVPTKKINCYI